MEVVTVNGIAGALFLGMAILSLGIAVTTGLGMAWAMAVLNFVLSALNLVAHLSKEQGGRRQ